MRVSLFSLLLVSCSFHSGEQRQARTNAHIAAMNYAQAVKQQNESLLVPLVHDQMVLFLGGDQAARRSFRRRFQKMQAKNLSYERVAARPVRALKRIQDSFYALVPLDVSLSSPRGVKNSVALLLGVSRSKARFWTFIELEKLSRQDLMDMIGPRDLEELEAHHFTFWINGKDSALSEQDTLGAPVEK